MHVPRVQFGAIIDPDFHPRSPRAIKHPRRRNKDVDRGVTTDTHRQGRSRSWEERRRKPSQRDAGESRGPEWKTANQYCHKHCPTHPIHSPRFIQRFSYRVDFYRETTDHDVMTTNRSIRSTVPSPVRSLTGVPQVSNRTSKSGSDTMSS